MDPRQDRPGPERSEAPRPPNEPTRTPPPERQAPPEGRPSEMSRLEQALAAALDRLISLERGLGRVGEQVASTGALLRSEMASGREAAGRELVEQVEAVQQQVGASTGALREQLGNANAAVRDELHRGMGAMREATEAAVRELRQVATATGERTAALDAELREDFRTLRSSLETVVTERIDALRADIEGGLWGRLEGLRDAIEGLAAERLEVVRGALETTLSQRMQLATEDLEATLSTSLADLREQLDRLGVSVGQFGSSLAEQLVGALDRAREEAPDVDELLEALREALERTLAGAQDRTTVPVEELRRTVEAQLGKLKEQVAYGMSALLRQMDSATRGAAGRRRDPAVDRPDPRPPEPPA